MYAALDAVGFAPVRHASRVVLFEPRRESVRQHMFVTIAIGGATYVIDPGFGPFACPLPIPIDGTPVPTSAPTHRLVREGNDWVLTSPVTANKSKAGSPRWRRSTPSISR